MTIPEVFAKFPKPYWKLKVEAGDGPHDGSKIAGTPLLDATEEWPLCGNCKKEMPLFLQLNTSSLPEPIKKSFGPGWVQLFYCTNEAPLCEVEVESYFPFSSAVTARFINPTEKKPGKYPEEDPFPATQIVGWTEKADYPQPIEFPTIELAQAEEEAYAANFPAPGDKLGGWPRWTQGANYPGCPVCSKTMSLLFQIDSEDHLPFMFGDVGTSQLTFCEDHPDQLAFAWDSH